ncbi:uncharacterized protein PHACADRAFT_209440 [Phanerochaete carnosa HHB-10118-sp]|uniref:Arrestin-like N-terminal domain-containing protein n=1 Tax=Phanerochaete carnosa (strain HHB-10118-sp) TaxID=650164 RepID=K5W9Q4_PHACS|nr:uncharacterized protein PHACADRAFT_209440 [Phanerochaete carnosa HHB-10118-sp]EKM55930.1 hypothetical protein PHACADRAFT_209440 [Phanerochaete carnosa HHB-10118-sp]
MEDPALEPQACDYHASKGAAPSGRAGAPPYPEPVVHCYPLTHKDGKTWATLRVHSRASSAELLPRLVQGEPIQGSLDLELPKETSIKSISVSIVGNLVSNANTRYEFAHESCTLWSTQEGESLPEGGEQLHRGKLEGTFSWPFSLELPQTVDLHESEGRTATYPLPSFISSAWSLVNVAYTLQATIKHGSFLHPDHIISTSVMYTTKTRPEPPSPARQLAYEGGAPLLGPEQDPSGWQVAPPVTFHGNNSGGQDAEVTYTLALAKPLSYTRGSVIPLHVIVACSNEQVLGALSAPEALNVCLLRTCKSGYDVLGGDFSVGAGSRQPLAAARHTDQRRFLYERVQKAVWWLEPSIDAAKCMLQGEIHLSPHLDPTTHLGMYDHTYDVVLYPPDVSAFSFSRDTASQVHPVEICTMYAAGPRPAARLPPTYDEIKRMNGRPFGMQAAWANF